MNGWPKPSANRESGMLQAAIDFRTESQALYDLLAPLNEADFERPTQFKDWTINHVLQHLHYFNYAADLSLTDEPAFLELLADLMAQRKEGRDLLSITDKALKGLKGRALLDNWQSYFTKMSENFADADPKRRLKWVGPDMSVLSSISARLMETWSHGQEIYDLRGIERVDGDQIRNIVVMGNNTFGWTFINRGEQVPADRPFLKLTAPSGKNWQYNDPSEDNCIEGAASEFCQVVTQTRNIADTNLTAVGATASRWMAVAQCFGGEAHTPPAPGTRHRQS
jgi:uncharacterized protein (TIGR03084 family)